MCPIIYPVEKKKKKRKQCHCWDIKVWPGLVYDPVQGRRHDVLYNHQLFTAMTFFVDDGVAQASFHNSMGNSGNHCSFVLLAEFHIYEGAQLKYQFPQPLGIDEGSTFLSFYLIFTYCNVECSPCPCSLMVQRRNRMIGQFSSLTRPLSIPYRRYWH